MRSSIRTSICKTEEVTSKSNNRGNLIVVAAANNSRSFFILTWRVMVDGSLLNKRLGREISVVTKGYQVGISSAVCYFERNARTFLDESEMFVFL